MSGVYRCRDDLVTWQIVGETLIIPISGELASMDNIFSLNNSGAYIWQQLDGQRSLTQIHRGLVDEFDVAADESSADLLELIEALQVAGLVEKVVQ